LSLYLPTIPHCRRIHCPWALVDANGTVAAGVTPASNEGPEPKKKLAHCIALREGEK
jgi:hypothetical protein